MTNKHTPEWEVFTDNETGFFAVGHKSTDYSGTEYGIVAENIDFNANAHLIAAAPELLRELECVIDTLSTQVDGFRTKHGDLVARAQAAIAKARGG